ncbi:MAG: UDP-N-acetylmuramoyl-tripeptide--D-alanyl-D-alanine ligase [Candidatus Acidiferrales bacterium]
MPWTVKEIGEALGVAAPAGVASEKLAGFSIDSRTLRPGELFIAIQGPNHDGHDFVAQALLRGAMAAVVGEERRALYQSEWRAKLLGVPDTFAALQQLGRAARRRWGGRLIGVTGSTGKTTTKELLAALLATRYRVLKSEGNLNNEYGVPLTLLRLEASHERAVIEMAMSHKGELAKLCQVAEPNVGLVTNVAPVHLEFFSSLEEIAEAKRELIHGLAPPATAVLNADDARVSRFAEGFSGRVLRFGFETPAEVRAENISDHGCQGSEFDLVTAQERGRVRLFLPGRAHISNAVAAFAAASLDGVGVRDAAKVFATFEPASLRGARVSFPAGFTVVNDAYNSNPRALAAMAEALSRTPGARRRIVVAGEMKELGPSSPELHRQAGAGLAALGNIDFLAGVTGDAVDLVEGALAGGFPRARAFFFETRGAASGWLCGVLEPGDWVLLKASRGVGIETVLEALKSYFSAEPVVTNASVAKE